MYQATSIVPRTPPDYTFPPASFAFVLCYPMPVPARWCKKRKNVKKHYHILYLYDIMIMIIVCKIALAA